MQKEQILSCIQPSGELHLGNYFGAIDNWIKLQKDYKCIYGVVDYHAMTMPYKPNQLANNTLSMLVDLIACGVDPGNLFIQSMVPEHTELAWILSCMTSFGDLQRQVQFKEKSNQTQECSQLISCGLFTYPVLQAADILMYHADKVPVGIDQQQHLELARSIAVRFNTTFDCQYFKEPACHFSQIPKLMSLADPTKKMSKSLGRKHYIGLFEEDTSIFEKIQAATTQSALDPENIGPGLQNMFEILKACGRNDVADNFLYQYHSGTLKFKTLKNEVYDAITCFTAKLKAARKPLEANRDLVEKTIINSSNSIRLKAQKTLREVRGIAGLSRYSANY